MTREEAAVRVLEFWEKVASEFGDGSAPENWYADARETLIALGVSDKECLNALDELNRKCI